LTALLKQEYLTARGSFNGKKLLPAVVLDSILAHTAFLNYNATINTRVSYIITNTSTQLLCRNCNTPLEIKAAIYNPPKYCSSKCNATSNETKNLKASTSERKYGYKNVFQSPEVKQKISSTNIKKFGSANPAKSQVVKDKISKKAKVNSPQRLQKAQETVRQKYGVDHISQLDLVKDKKKQTCIDRYGTEYYFSTNACKFKSKQTMMRLYGVENASHSPYFIDKIRSTKFNKYRDSSYNNRDQALSTMIKTYGDVSARQHWSTLATRILLSPDELVEYAAGKTINYMATSLEVAPTTVYLYLKKYNISNFDSRNNQYEDLISSFLDTYGIEYKTNTRTIIPPLELDFYIPEHNLCIECNGIFWHSELMGKDRAYHMNKTTRCNDIGLQLWHLWDYQIDRNPDLIKSMLTHKLLKQPDRIGARSCSVVNLTAQEYRSFLDENHIQQSINSKIKLGLLYNNEVLAVMGLGASRFEKDTWELHRFSVKKNYHVPGAPSKLFNNFLKNQHNCHKIVSYASRDFSNGNMYQQLGFKFVDHTPPGYFYFKSRVVFNRVAFQKHKLKDKLEHFDASLSEWQNMINNGYNRFWNTGNIKYEFTR